MLAAFRYGTVELRFKNVWQVLHWAKKEERSNSGTCFSGITRNSQNMLAHKLR
jgi:hypothetical protein